MSVQMIELQEVMMLEVSDEVLEASGEKALNTTWLTCTNEGC